MEFFRAHRKIIVSIIAVATILWMVGMSAITAVLATKGM